MNEPILMVRVERTTGGTIRVKAPAVGWWSNHPPPGALVGPGSRIGLFTVLNRRYALVLPDGAAGRLASALPRTRAVPVEHGETLFELAPVTQGSPEEIGGAVPGHPTGDDIPEGARAVVSPTDGFFYRKASPDVPPFVEVGTRVRSGQTLGLVEVMKTFNQIVYGGPGFPEEGEILEIRTGDAEEVRAGQVLMVVR